MSETLNCFKCGYTTEARITQCPQCGGRVRSASQIRALGVVLVVIGIILVLVMSFITIWAMNLILQTGKPGVTSRFSGTTGDMVFMFSVFALVLSIGFASLAGGIWQIAFGRANKVLSYLILGLGAIFFIIGTVIKSLG